MAIRGPVRRYVCEMAVSLTGRNRGEVAIAAIIAIVAIDRPAGRLGIKTNRSGIAETAH